MLMSSPEELPTYRHTALASTKHSGRVHRGLSLGRPLSPRTDATLRRKWSRAAGAMSAAAAAQAVRSSLRRKSMQ